MGHVSVDAVGIDGSNFSNTTALSSRYMAGQILLRCISRVYGMSCACVKDNRYPTMSAEPAAAAFGIIRDRLSVRCVYLESSST
jgi:hypothetical protein